MTLLDELCRIIASIRNLPLIQTGRSLFDEERPNQHKFLYELYMNLLVY
jgi:hypothetical protein